MKTDEKKIRRYVKKPVEIEAVLWDGKIETVKEMNEWSSLCGGPKIKYGPHFVLIIHTLEGDMTARVGDYIIKGIRGELYPCKPDIFKETYEEAIQ